MLSPSDRLLAMAGKGDAAGIAAALRDGADVNAADSEGRTSLYIASREGHVDVIKALVAAGADVHRARDGHTPLYIATQNGHVGAIMALLAGGAAVNCANKNGATPLHIASQKSHVAAIKALLSGGASVNAGMADGSTPLHIASQWGHVEALEALVAGGADVKRPDKKGAAALHIASQSGHAGVIRGLVAGGADANAANCDGETPLCIAAQFGHVGAVKALLVGGAGVNRAMSDGWTPLHVASWSGHVDAAKALLDASADTGVRSSDGKRPVDVVCMYATEADKSNASAITALLSVTASKEEPSATPPWAWVPHAGGAPSSHTPPPVFVAPPIPPLAAVPEAVPRYDPIRRLGAGAFGTATLAKPFPATAAALRLPPATLVVVKTSKDAIPPDELAAALREVETLRKVRAAGVPRRVWCHVVHVQPSPIPLPAGRSRATSAC